MGRKEAGGMKEAVYLNPWHHPGKDWFGPQFYKTMAEPKEYCGYLIYERIDGKVFDIVENDKCVGQYAGMRGAKEFIDKLIVEGPSGD